MTGYTGHFYSSDQSGVSASFFRKRFSTRDLRLKPLIHSSQNMVKPMAPENSTLDELRMQQFKINRMMQELQALIGEFEKLQHDALKNPKAAAKLAKINHMLTTKFDPVFFHHQCQQLEKEVIALKKQTLAPKITTQTDSKPHQPQAKTKPRGKGMTDLA